MIAQSTATHSVAHVERTVADLTIFAVQDMLHVVEIVLLDTKDVPMRAAQYTVSTTASGWTNQEPGNNLWPKILGTRLLVIATLSDAWWVMSDAAKARFRERTGLQGTWDITSIDTSFSGLGRTVDRRFASNGYGMEKALYEKRVRS
jgi:HORMA domain-containing protein